MRSQQIYDDLGDEEILWRSRRIRQFFADALSKGWCFHLPICRSSDDWCSILYYPNPYQAVKWLAANPDWVAQQAGCLPEMLGISEEVIDKCRTGTWVYAVYGGKLAVVEPGLLLAEIYERCAESLGLPATWAAHIGDEDVGEDYRTKAGDVIDFCEEIVISAVVKAGKPLAGLQKKDNKNTSGGRPPQWDNLWAIIQEQDKINPKLKDAKIASIYNQTFSTGPKAKAKTVSDVRRRYKQNLE